MVVVGEAMLIVEGMFLLPVPEFHEPLQTVLSKLGQNVDVELFVLGEILAEDVEVRGGCLLGLEVVVVGVSVGG